MRTKAGAVTGEDFAALLPVRPANNASFESARTAPATSRDEAIASAIAAVEAALDSLGIPVAVLSTSGEIVLTSTAARALGVNQLEHLKRLPAGGATSGAGDGTWELVPLETHDGRSGFIATLRSSPSNKADFGLYAKAKRRWQLTPRQEQVLSLIARGYTNALVAEALGIAESTVEFHLTAVFDKAGVCNRATLLARLFSLRD